MSQRLKSMDYPECEGDVNATAHYYMLMKEGRDQYPGEDLHELDYAVREALEGAYGKTYISPGVVDALDREGISVEAADPTDWSLGFAADNPLFGWGGDPNKPKHYLVKSYRYGRRDRGYETKFKRPNKKAAMDYAKSLASEYVRLPQDHRAEIVVYAVYPSGKEQEVWTSYQPSKIAANNPRRAKAPTRKNTGHPKRRNAKLTAADKAKMPLRDFAIPSKRGYPMHTEAYAKRAISYAQWRGKRDLPEVKKAVFARYPSLISWWNENHPESPWKTRSSTSPPGGRPALVAIGKRHRQREKAKRSGRTALKQKARQHRTTVLLQQEIADLKKEIAAAKKPTSGKIAQHYGRKTRKNARLVEQDPKWETEGDWRSITVFDGYVETDQHYKGHRLRVEKKRRGEGAGWDLYIDGEERGELRGDHTWWDAAVEAEKLVDAGRSNPRRRKNRRKR